MIGVTLMEKNLYHTLTVNDENEHFTFEYYITKTVTDGLLYYGVLGKDSNNARHISGIFPYEQNAREFADDLLRLHVTPLSVKDMIAEYITEKVVS